MGKAFISYVRENSDKVEKLVEQLEANGIKVWWDKKDIKVGDDWLNAIKNGIRKGSFFIACFSKEYNMRSKNHMNEELRIAIGELRKMGNQKWFLPLRLNECEIPDIKIDSVREFSDFHFLDMFPDFEKSADKIVAEVNRNKRNQNSIDFKNLNQTQKKQLGIIQNYKPEGVGNYTINKWSKNRVLKREFHEMLISNERKPFFNLISEEKFNKYVELKRATGRDGQIGYLSGFVNDFKEDVNSDRFIMKVSTCRYFEHLASWQLMHDDKELSLRIKSILDNNLENYFMAPIPANITVNCILIAENEMLALRRGSGTATVPYIWGIGAYETMMFDTKKYYKGVVDNNLFELAERGIHEELGLRPYDYNNFIRFTWFGLAARSLRSHVVCIIKTDLTKEEIIDKYQNAHSNLEYLDHRWIPIKLSVISDFIERFNSGKRDERTFPFYVEIDGEKWITDTALSISEVWRLSNDEEKEY